jgi:hypothetical protein
MFIIFPDSSMISNAAVSARYDAAIQLVQNLVWVDFDELILSTHCLPKYCGMLSCGNVMRLCVLVQRPEFPQKIQTHVLIK